jgi:hypothetical protein
MHRAMLPVAVVIIFSAGTMVCPAAYAQQSGAGSPSISGTVSPEKSTILRTVAPAGNSAGSPGIPVTASSGSGQSGVGSPASGQSSAGSPGIPSTFPSLNQTSGGSPGIPGSGASSDQSSGGSPGMPAK